MAIQQHRMSRERILEGAGSILQSGKVAHLTVDALARSLSMSKSTLYKYFASKEDVVVALVEEACVEADAEIARVLSVGGPLEQLEELASIIGRHGRRVPRAVLVEPYRLPPVCAERLRQTRSHFSDAVHEVLERGVRDATFHHPAPDIVATAFVASAIAILTEAARSDRADVQVATGHLPGLFLPALRG